MSTFVVTTANWNSPAFWGGISTSGTGQTLDFSGLPATYTVTVDDFFGAITISDGATTFVAKDSASGVSADATMDGSSLLSHSDTVVGTAGDNDVTGSTDDETITTADGDDTIDGGGGSDSITAGGGNDSVTIGDPAPAGTIIAGGNNQNATIGADTYIWESAGGNSSITLGGGTLGGGGGDDIFIYNPGDGDDTIADFNFGNTGALNDGDNTNNDFIDLTLYYTSIFELRDDFRDDNILNQSDGDYSDNTAMGGSLTFSGANASSFTTDNTGVVCFAAGTMILTDRGEVPVERLRAGDLVQTMDNGLQPVAMLVSRRLGAVELARRPELKPIELKPGALGGDRRLIVSPQHAMLVAHGGTEMLVRARQLSRMKGGAVRVMHGCKQVTYVHLIFDAHQIVFANERASESFFPGPRALAALAPEARQEFDALFLNLPQDVDKLRRCVGYDPARTFLKTKHLPKAHAQLAQPDAINLALKNSVLQRQVGKNLVT